MQGCAWGQVLQAHHRGFVRGQEALGRASVRCSLLAPRCCSSRGGFQAFQRQAPVEFISPPWCNKHQAGSWKSRCLRVRTWLLGQAQPCASCDLPMPPFL